MPRAVRSLFPGGIVSIPRQERGGTRGVHPFLKDDGFKVETEAARRDRAELVMSASFQVAQILQGQQNFDDGDRRLEGISGQVSQRSPELPTPSVPSLTRNS